MPAPRPDAARAEAADVLGRVGPLVTRWIERLLAAGDPLLTPAQHQALAAVADGVGTSAELARRTGVSAAAVSQLLGALEAAALVRRVPGEDRRRQDLALTEAGERALAAADATLRERLAEALPGLPAPEADALARSLAQVRSALAGTPPPPRPPRPPRPGPPPRPPWR